MASTDASEKPYKGLAYRLYFALYDADRDLVSGGASDTPDSQISKDGGTSADCTNEMTEVATSTGHYYIDLTATEMNAAHIGFIAKTATAGTKTTYIDIYPSLEVIERGTAQASTASTLVLRASPRLAAGDGFFTNHRVRIIDGTGEGQMRFITGYTHSGVSCTIDRDWGNTPSTDSIYEILMDDISAIDIDGRLPGALTGAGNMKSDMKEINDSATAALNVGSIYGSMDGEIDATSATNVTIVADDSNIEAVNDFYTGQTIVIYGGTGRGQSRVVTGYVGSTKTFTISPAWGTTPDATSDFVVGTVTSNAGAIADIQARLPAALSSAGNIKSDVEEVNEQAITGDGASGTEFQGA